jgi:2-phosphoglycerate kinase
MGEPALPWYGSACCMRPRADSRFLSLVSRSDMWPSRSSARSAADLATSHIVEGLKTDQRHLGGTLMAESEVILIGGAPFSGQTTRATRLAVQRGYALVAIDDLSTALRAMTTPQSHPALHPLAGWEDRAYYIEHPSALLIHQRMRAHDAVWPAIVAVIDAHLHWAGPVILEGWQLDPERVRAITPPQLRTCWLLVDDAVLEARLRADTAFYQGCTHVEHLIRQYLARRRWVNDQVRQAAVYEVGVVLEVAPGETVDAITTRCLQRLWPGAA